MDNNENNSVEEDKGDAMEAKEGNHEPKSEPVEKRTRTEASQATTVPHEPHGLHHFVAASPPKFVSLDEIMAAADGVSNMVLAHEIAVDANFKVEAPKPPKDSNSLEARVYAMMRKAFWDVLREKLSEDPPDYSHALSLLQEVKEGLYGIILPGHARLRQEIDEVLDLDLISQQVEHEALDLHRYSRFVIATLARLCAPARDEQVSKLNEISEIVPLFQGILETLDILKVDMANYTIQQVRPFLMQQSVAYECKKFDEFLQKQKESGVDGLECTKAWLDRSLIRHRQKHDASAAEATAAAAKSEIKSEEILNSAFMELLDWPENLLFPETLLMDHKRYESLQHRCQQLVQITSILLVTYSTTGAPVAGIADFKEKLVNQLTVLLFDNKDRDEKETLESISEQVSKEVAAVLEKHGFKALGEEQQSLLREQIKATGDREHAVTKLMRSRLETFILELLTTHKKASDSRIPPGFSSVAKQLSQITGEFLRLVHYNRSVFGKYYSEILDSLLK